MKKLLIFSSAGVRDDLYSTASSSGPLTHTSLWKLWDATGTVWSSVLCTTVRNKISKETKKEDDRKITGNKRMREKNNWQFQEDPQQHSDSLQGRRVLYVGL